MYRTTRLSILSLGGLVAPATLFAQDKAGINAGDTAWVLSSTALVLMMTIPALALFYGGMVRKKNIIATIQYSMAATVIVSLLWVVAQYSLVFAPSADAGLGPWFGNLSRAFMSGVGIDSVHPNAATIPESAFSMFQLMFAIITVALISGAVVERMTFSAWCVFVVFWSLIVYAPLAHWVWNPAGWLFKAGALDFAGGLVVHSSSGVSALVLVLLLGPRASFRREPVSAPANIGYVFIGASLLWVGWFGFNAGSAVAANGVAASAFLVTNTAAAMAALVWIILESAVHGKPSLVGASTGAVAGLVAITPASGYVGVGGALFLGAVTSLISFTFMSRLRARFKYDDALDVFSVHGLGGIWGALGTGLFANGLVAGGAKGVFFGKPAQVLIQLESIFAAVLIAVTGTIVSWFLTRLVVRGRLRASDSEQASGLDLSEHGEIIESAS
ncbi:MAG TPA: ammonium transporter [Rectinemataceae bacterium]|nr:ammonium transporter [Rectinemataceae bacterium]